MSRFQSYIHNLQRFGIRPDLQRIQALLDRAGSPHEKFPHLLVGGTNGKGSTCEFAAHLLAQNGRTIGLYTSPHLYKWNERIRILPGEGLFEGSIGNAPLEALFDETRPFIDSVTRDLGQPTEFEIMTFLGLLHFAREKVDAAVLEVGLGGKWDATNASDPVVSCVTHVALDHCDRLGDTLEKIAADKVCIARANRPFLTGETRPTVRAVMENYCAQIGAPFFNPLLPAVAPRDYQKNNLHLAREVVQHFCTQLGWPLPQPLPSQRQVRGRTEQIAPNLYLDGANNPEGARTLADFLQSLPNVQNLILVLGILADKDWPEMTKALAPLAQTVICTQSISPRALSATVLAQEAEKYNGNVQIALSVEDAVTLAQNLSQNKAPIVVTGSFTTIAEVARPSS